MSELQFPQDPIVGQQYDFPPYKYYWDGAKWKTMGIGYNPVNDLRNELEPRIETSENNIEDLSAQSFEALRRSYAEAGLNLVDGSFEEGGTLTSSIDVLLHKVSGKVYSGKGPFPETVALDTDPTQSADWVDVTEESLRGQLAAVGSQVLIGGVKAGTIAANSSSGLYRNKIVDGRFDFWYEGINQTSLGYGSDTMWLNYHYGSFKSHIRLPLDIGSSLPNVDNPSALYASRTTVASVTGAENYVRKMQKIENAWTLAGKKATFSFYAKADAAKNLGIHIEQSFGDGGSPSAIVNVMSTKLAITDQWVRYSLTFDVPSVYGKTFGTNGDSTLNIIFGFDQGSSFSSVMGGLGHQSGVFDIACVQLEEGEQATKFEELPMSISENLVGRYYETSYPDDVAVGTPGTEGSRGGYRGFTHPKATYKAYGAATQFRVAKQKIPTVSVFHVTTGVKGSTLFDGGSLGVSTIGGVGKNGFASITFSPTPTAANADVAFHYVADARL